MNKRDRGGRNPLRGEPPAADQPGETPAPAKSDAPALSWDAVLVAAGRGERMGLGMPKARAPLGGLPMFLHALRTLWTHPGRNRLIVVFSSEEGEREQVKESIRDVLGLEAADIRRGENDPAEKLLLAPGGEERQDSVWAGLSALQSFGLSQHDVVLIHDAARPLVSHALISRCLEAILHQVPSPQAELPGLATHGRAPGPAGVVPGLPVQETLKLVYESRVVLTQPRENLYAIQTPQVFRFGPLLDSHQRARRYGIRATDDAALLERVGTTVLLVPGEAVNLKVTVRADLELAERLMRTGHA